MCCAEDSRLAENCAAPYHRRRDATSERPNAASERTPLRGDCDVLICGASFAGLAVARELAGSGAEVLVIDRYEIGERQTSACGIPTGWLEVMELIGRPSADLRRARDPHAAHDRALRAAVDVLHLRLSDPLRPAGRAGRLRVRDREGRRRRRRRRAHRPRRDARAADRRRARAGGGCSAAASRSSRRTPTSPAVWRSTRTDAAQDLEIWIDRSYVPAGYGWSFPADAEVRVGVGSFDPRYPRQGSDRAAGARSRTRALRISGQLDPAPDPRGDRGRVFFAGDSAGHCLPLTAEGIRTALYFGIACGRELRAVLEGEQSKPAALAAYGAFSAMHTWKFESMLRVQRLVPRVPPRLLAPTLRLLGRKRVRRLVLQPLPADRAARVRARAAQRPTGAVSASPDANAEPGERPVAGASVTRSTTGRSRCAAKVSGENRAARRSHDALSSSGRP